MSDAEFEEDEEPEEVFEELTLDKLKTDQDIIDYLSDVIYDRWYNGLIGSQASPWASANDFARYIASFARSGIVDDSSLISALAEASGLDYNTFKRLWDRLPRNRKVSLLNLIAYDVALGGFAKFMESLTNTLKNYDEKVRKQVAEAASKYLKADLLHGPNEQDSQRALAYGSTLKNYDDKARKQVAEAASKYLKGKMSYTDLMNRIASALWPKGASRNDSRYVDFLHGAELANYILKHDIEWHIKHMLEGLKKHKWF